METAEDRMRVLQRAIREGNGELPRPAFRFLTALLAAPDLLERMRFCRPDDRRHLRDSVLVSTADGGLYSVMLGNEGARGERGGGDRARLALEGLGLSIVETLSALRACPIWFLALDDTLVCVPEGEALRIQETVYRLAALSPGDIRRQALQDQLDAALEEHDFAACARLRTALQEI